MSGRSENGAFLGFAGLIIAALIGAYATIVAARGPEAAPDPDPFAPPGVAEPPVPARSTRIDNVRVEHDAVEGTRTGVRVHARVTTAGRKGVKQSVATYFAVAGRPLRDGNGHYLSEDGAVSTGTSFVPEYNESNAQDVAMFIPLDELELSAGVHEVSAEVKVFDEALDTFTAGAAPVTFTYTSGDAPAERAASVVFQRVWIEHNVVAEGVNGMRIHVAFSAYELLGEQLVVAVGFSDTGGTVLRDFDQRYRHGDGGAGVSTTATPVYEAARFDDLVLFMPYPELHMRPGTHALEARVGVARAGQPGFLAVSDPVAFTYTS